MNSKYTDVYKATAAYLYNKDITEVSMDERREGKKAYLAVMALLFANTPFTLMAKEDV